MLHLISSIYFFFTVSNHNIIDGMFLAWLGPIRTHRGKIDYPNSKVTLRNSKRRRIDSIHHALKMTYSTREEEDDEYYLTPTLERLRKLQKKSSRSLQRNLFNQSRTIIDDTTFPILRKNFYSSTNFTSSSLKIGKNSNEVPLISGLVTSHLGLDPTRNTRHAPIVYHERYSFPNWPINHTFPMNKFEQTAFSLLNDPDEFLMSCVGDDSENQTDFRVTPLVMSSQHFYKPLSFENFSQSFMTPPICPKFLQSFLSATLTREECRVIGFREHMSRSELIERTVLEVAGTVLTAQLAMKYGMASHIAGGTHHAEKDKGKGFTILNDLAVVARLMTWKEEDDVAPNGDDNFLKTFFRGDNGPLDRILVVDCDVHQGDGTATFHSDSTLCNNLFTLDLHAASNYPHPKARCTFDIPLPDKCTDVPYLLALTESLDKALYSIKPQLVLYNAGVDVYYLDKLGRLSLSWEGMKQRDLCVIGKCVDSSIPVAVVIGGGYDADVRDLGKRHALVHRVCAHIWRKQHMWSSKKLNAR